VGTHVYKSYTSSTTQLICAQKFDFQAQMFKNRPKFYHVKLYKVYTGPSCEICLRGYGSKNCTGGLYKLYGRVVKIVRGVVKTVYGDDHDCPSPNVCGDEEIHCTGLVQLCTGFVVECTGFVVGTVRNW